MEALNKKDLGEIKAYTKPPELVETVLIGVMILRMSEPTWSEAKRQLGDSNFIKSLVNFDKENISDKTLKRIGQICAKPDFKPDTVGRVSLAAKSLCMWVRAMEVYGRIFRVVEPKKKVGNSVFPPYLFQRCPNYCMFSVLICFFSVEPKKVGNSFFPNGKMSRYHFALFFSVFVLLQRLEDANHKLSEKQKSLAEAREKLQEVKDKLESLQKQYEEKLVTKEELKKKAELTELRLDRAAKLVHGLAGERVRWEASVKV